MTQHEIKLRLNARMRDLGHCVFGQLSARYVEQARTTGTATTAEDAFEAWLDWLKGQGGKPVTPLTLGTDPAGFHAAAAQSIRDVSPLLPA